MRACPLFQSLADATRTAFRSASRSSREGDETGCCCVRQCALRLRYAGWYEYAAIPKRIDWQLSGTLSALMRLDCFPWATVAIEPFSANADRKPGIFPD